MSAESFKDSDKISGKSVLTEDRRAPVTGTKNLELINKVANVLMQSLNINEILEKILDYIFDQLKRIERGAILLVNTNTGELEQITGRSRYGGGKTAFTYNHG